MDQQTTGRRVLVTGGSGFVGANLVRHLLADGHQVTVLMRPGWTTWRLADVLDRLRVVEVELTDAVSLEAAVARLRPEWLFHLAVHGAYSSQTDVRQMVATNVVGTVNLVESALAHGCEVIVNTGSSSEYGFKDHAPSEREWLEPNSAYAATKAAATLYCRQVAQARGCRLVTLRLYSVYGPYEEPSRLVPTLIARGLDGQLPPLVDPSIARDFVYVDDVIDAYRRAAMVPGIEAGAVFNVGSGHQTTMAEIVATVRQLLDITAEPRWGSMAARQWDSTIWTADSRRIGEALGWRSTTTLQMGLSRMIAWLRADPARLAHYQATLATGSRPR